MSLPSATMGGAGIAWLKDKSPIQKPRAPDGARRRHPSGTPKGRDDDASLPIDPADRQPMRAEPSVPAAILAAIRAPFAAAGATPVDPPVIQPLNQLLDLAGEQMRARLFIVQDEGGREACLRPDFTVPVARAHLASGATAGRYLYEGKAFRVAPRATAEAHPEEFLQIGLEVYGGPGDAAEDAALAALAWRAAAAGGRDDLFIRLGDIRLIGAVLDAIDVPPLTRTKLIGALAKPRILESILDRAQATTSATADPLTEVLGDLSGEAAAQRLEAVWRERGLEQTGGRSALEIVARLERRRQAASAPRLTERQADLIRKALAITGSPDDALRALKALASGLDAAIEGWRTRIAALAEAGVPTTAMTLEPGFGRAFGYYDGFLFEIGAGGLEADAPVAAGGRYDGLIPLLGGTSAGAVGCIVRPARAWTGAAA